MKRYRTERGYFPQDMRAFEYYSDYTRAAMQSMRENEYRRFYKSLPRRVSYNYVRDTARYRRR